MNDKNYTCLGLDPSFSACGIALIDENNALLINETIAFKKSLSRLKTVYDYVHTLIHDLKSSFNLRVIAKEDYSYQTQRGIQRSFMQGELGGVVNLAILSCDFALGKDFFIIPPTSWKKLILGAGNIAKDTAYVAKCNKKLSMEFENDGQIDSYCLARTAKTIIETLNGELQLSNFNQAEVGALVDAKKLKENELTLARLIKQGNNRDFITSLHSFKGGTNE